MAAMKAPNRYRSPKHPQEIDGVEEKQFRPQEFPEPAKSKMPGLVEPTAVFEMSERDPVMLIIPNQNGQSKEQIDQEREVGPGCAKFGTCRFPQGEE